MVCWWLCACALYRSSVDSIMKHPAFQVSLAGGEKDRLTLTHCFPVGRHTSGHS
ncbi:hypothetical protein JOB18_013548 [Solea senegalensis]|uniref:Uncharacterized protein n=1 Tax=Solea senegalensis TaxID=28829 RepID=A0AAV6QSS9_SOLSE|nr:hypothetical protein JOB18_013548 [Solea senegalensis]